MLMVLVELVLLLTYTCVLLIKSCDISSLATVRFEARLTIKARTVFIKAMCSGYGFGETASGESSVPHNHISC